MAVCSSCGTESQSGAKFCLECGARLSAACAVCGAPLPPAAKFCSECGARLMPGPAPMRQPQGGSASSLRLPTAPVAERRLVSILFADLVGSTAIAEGRDPEETRDLLTRYFDLAREIVGRYGGTVEKFIGDAVMAVWGAPTAQEDDAERAVRAGLELVAAVRSLGPAIQARAGVLTGEAAVTLDAVGQGMVAGDLVNTASRLQSVAAPGTVLVGETTQRAAAAAIAFESAGVQTLRGKAAPVAAWRALRVVGERGGRQRADTLEAPFVGRDDELRLLKDLFHATGREGRARLVSVMGPAGIGKSRLAWEFLKYIDGLVEQVWWHEGRSPAYGEGISFWALSEMVRRRCGLLESDDEATTRAKVAAALREHIADESERRWVEGALLTLLGASGPTTASAELFGAWRTFFERLADSGTVVLVFEDFNNADPGLIDFVDHLLEWSRGHPIYVLTLARPELLERRADWHAKRNFTALALEPLPEAAMQELLAGLVPGLPPSAIRAIVRRADGVPLYAVETVRMLLAEGKLALHEGTYVPVGDLSEVAVPETLTALISSRIDSLDPAERSLIHDAAVLGQSFTAAGLAAVSGTAEAVIEPHLRALVRREILARAADPRSPERGNYAFVQALVREIAYHTLARADRKSRHLAAARFFASLDSDELVGAVASHYLAAYQNASDSEADELAAQARVALHAAADRAAALGSYEQAATSAEQALAVTTDQAERAALLEQAGDALSRAARHDAAIGRIRDAVAIYAQLGDRPSAARATAQLGRAYGFAYRPTEARTLLEEAVADFADLADEPEGLAIRLALARTLFLSEDDARSVEVVDSVLPLVERLELTPLIAQALTAKGSALLDLGRAHEGLAILRAGIELSESIGATADALVGRVALQATLGPRDPQASMQIGRAGLAEARRLGLRARALMFAGNLAESARWTGDWQEAIGEVESLLEGELDDGSRAFLLPNLVVLRAWRGEDVSSLLALAGGLLAAWSDAGQRDISNADLDAHLALAEGRAAEARAAARLEARLSALNAPMVLPLAARAAVWLRDPAAVAEDVAALDATGVHGPWVSLRRTALLAGIAALEGRADEARARYREARGGFIDLGVAFEAALVAIDMTSTLGPEDPDATAAAAEARPVLERLGARPFLARLDTALRSASEITSGLGAGSHT